MSTFRDWQESANRHTNINRRIMQLAEKRIAMMERVIEGLEQTLGSDPANFMVLYKNIQFFVNVEELEALSRIVDRSMRAERLSSGMKYNDLNEISKAMDQCGYYIVPKAEYDNNRARLNASRGISIEAMHSLKQALGIVPKVEV